MGTGTDAGDVARLTEKKIARVLTTRRIRRIAAADALALLQQPALTVAPGTATAAKAHIATAAERARLVNRQLKERYPPPRCPRRPARRSRRSRDRPGAAI